MLLKEFDFDIVHTPGFQNVVVEYLSHIEIVGASMRAANDLLDAISLIFQ